MQYFLIIIVVAVLLAMTLSGFHRGLIKTALGMLALILTIVLVWLLSPTVSSILKNNTSLYQSCTEAIHESLVDSLEPSAEESKEAQEQVIRNSFLPAVIQDELISHNEEGTYAVLGADTFLDYLSGYLAGIVVNICGFLLTFLVVFIGIRLILALSGVIGMIPGVHLLNKVGGALFGFLQGLVIVWLLCFVVMLLSPTAFGQGLVQAIEGNPFLNMIYSGGLSIGSFLKIGKILL